MRTAKEKKFKVFEKDAKDAPVKDIEWEGEEVRAESTTKLEDDKGIGQEIILRSFDFAALPQDFEKYRPTAQELFETHRKGIEAMLWADGLMPYKIIEPRLLFAKDKSHYRFVILCVPSLGNALIDVPHTLSELLNVA